MSYFDAVRTCPKCGALVFVVELQYPDRPLLCELTLEERRLAVDRWGVRRVEKLGFGGGGPGCPHICREPAPGERSRSLRFLSKIPFDALAAATCTGCGRLVLRYKLLGYAIDPGLVQRRDAREHPGLSAWPMPSWAAMRADGLAQRHRCVGASESRSPREGECGEGEGRP